MMDIAVKQKEKNAIALRNSIPMMKQIHERRLKILELFQKKLRYGENTAHISEIFNAIYGNHKLYNNTQIWDMTNVIAKDMRFFRLNSDKFAFIKGDVGSIYTLPRNMEEIENYTHMMDDITKRCSFMKKRAIRFVQERQYLNFDSNVDNFRRLVRPQKLLEKR